MSITEAIEKVKVLVNVAERHAQGNKLFQQIIEDAKDALPVIESYVQTHEGQGGLGL